MDELIDTDGIFQRIKQNHERFFQKNMVHYIRTRVTELVNIKLSDIDFDSCRYHLIN